MATRFDLISLLFHFVLHIGVQSPFHATQSSQAELTMWYLCLLQLRITLLWSCMVPEFVATHVSTLQQAQLDVKLLKPSESIAVVRFCGVPLSTQQQTDRQTERAALRPAKVSRDSGCVLGCGVVELGEAWALNAERLPHQGETW